MGVNEKVFPEGWTIQQLFRTVSHVLLQRRAALAAAQGDGPPPKLVVSNLFVCSGQGHHKVPGRGPEAKKKFKMKVVRHGVEKAVDFAERQATLASNVGAQRIDFLAAGDFNLHRDDVKDALVELAQDRDVGESLAIHCVPDEEVLPRQQKKHRDFILSSLRCGDQGEIRPAPPRG